MTAIETPPLLWSEALARRAATMASTGGVVRTTLSNVHDGVHATYELGRGEVPAPPALNCPTWCQGHSARGGTYAFEHYSKSLEIHGIGGCERPGSTLLTSMTREDDPDTNLHGTTMIEVAVEGDRNASINLDLTSARVLHAALGDLLRLASA